MDAKPAVEALAALAQESRLAVFRLLVEAGAVGVAAGDIGERLGIPANTLSFHLKTLAHAGLVAARQEGRFIYYAANYAAMDDLIAFLAHDCCGGGRECLPKTAAAATTIKRRAKAA